MEPIALDRPAGPAAERQPFFIVGPGRSGTTLLYELLRAHRSVALTNEAHLASFFHLCWALGSLATGAEAYVDSEHGRHRITNPVAQPYRPKLMDVYFRGVRGMMERFYAETFPDREFTHWGDKCPSTQPDVLDLLVKAFPSARFVALIRDPRDWVVSNRAASRWKESFADRPLDDLIDAWNAEWAHWCERPSTLLLRYEDLLGDSEATLRRTLEFLGLDSDPACAEALADRDRFRARSSTTASAEASVGRARQELDAEESRLIETGCAAGLKALGYPV